MRNKVIGFLLLLFILILSISCASGPDTGPVKQDPGSPVFDPNRVSQEYHVTTRDEVRAFVGEVNSIIRSRNYSAWRAVLTPEFIAEYSSPERLNEISESPVLKQQRVVLNSLEDYFRHVVVPSRANVSDSLNDIDIEFVTQNRVRAFSMSRNRAGEDVKQYLYDLEKINNSWKIMK